MSLVVGALPIAPVYQLQRRPVRRLESRVERPSSPASAVTEFRAGQWKTFATEGRRDNEQIKIYGLNDIESVAAASRYDQWPTQEFRPPLLFVVDDHPGAAALYGLMAEQLYGEGLPVVHALTIDAAKQWIVSNKRKLRHALVALDHSVPDYAKLAARIRHERRGFNLLDHAQASLDQAGAVVFVTSTERGDPDTMANYANRPCGRSLNHPVGKLDFVSESSMTPDTFKKASLAVAHFYDLERQSLTGQASSAAA